MLLLTLLSWNSSNFTQAQLTVIIKKRSGFVYLIVNLTPPIQVVLQTEQTDCRKPTVKSGAVAKMLHFHWELLSDSHSWPLIYFVSLLTLFFHKENIRNFSLKLRPLQLQRAAVHVMLRLPVVLLCDWKWTQTRRIVVSVSVSPDYVRPCRVSM